MDHKKLKKNEPWLNYMLSSRNVCEKKKKRNVCEYNVAGFKLTKGKAFSPLPGQTVLRADKVPTQAPGFRD